MLVFGDRDFVSRRMLAHPARGAGKRRKLRGSHPNAVGGGDGERRRKITAAISELPIIARPR